MDKKLIEDFDRKQKSYKHKNKKGKWEKEKSPSSSNHRKHGKQTKISTKLEKTEEATHKPSTSYRDRAQERRDGLNKDFELDPDDLIISNPIIDNSNQVEGDPDSNQVDDYALENEKQRRLQQIEESKYLGGDVEHTHLVKGLDFALLEKIKNDQKLADKLLEDAKKDGKNVMTNDMDSDSDEEEFRTNAILAASSLASSSSSKRPLVDIEKLKKGHSTEIVHCRTAKARNILNVLSEKWSDKSELFLPGRMSYILNKETNDEDEYNYDNYEGVTTILRSKADTLASNEPTTGMEADHAFMDKLIHIFSQSRKDVYQAEVGKSQRKTMTNYREADDMYDYEY